jgi:hypothetical protein
MGVDTQRPLFWRGGKEERAGEQAAQQRVVLSCIVVSCRILSCGVAWHGQGKESNKTGKLAHDIIITQPQRCASPSSKTSPLRLLRDEGCECGDGMGLEVLHTAFRQSKNHAKGGCRGLEWTAAQDTRIVTLALPSPQSPPNCLQSYAPALGSCLQNTLCSKHEHEHEHCGKAGEDSEARHVAHPPIPCMPAAYNRLKHLGMRVDRPYGRLGDAKASAPKRISSRRQWTCMNSVS